MTSTKVKSIALLLSVILCSFIIFGCTPQTSSDQAVTVTDNAGYDALGGDDARQTVEPTAAATTQGAAEPTKATIAPTATEQEATKTPAPTPAATPTPAPQKTESSATHYSSDKPMVALTYDDGPHSPVTNRILDLVEQYNIKVTFFLVGNRIKGNAEVVNRARSLGCELANHTYDHEVKLKGISRDKFRRAIDSVDDELMKYAGVKTTLIRPIGGFYDDNVLSMADKPFILWSVDTEDWRSHDKDEVFKIVKKEVKDGSIVLMHDLWATTGDASELVIPWLVEQGYQLVTVSELFEARGIKLEAGKAYYHAYPEDANPKTEASETDNE